MVRLLFVDLFFLDLRLLALRTWVHDLATRNPPAFRVGAPGRPRVSGTFPASEWTNATSDAAALATCDRELGVAGAAAWEDGFDLGRRKLLGDVEERPAGADRRPAAGGSMRARAGARQ